MCLRVFIVLMSCIAYVKDQLQILKLCFYLTSIVKPSTDVKSCIYFNADVSGLRIPSNNHLPTPCPWHSFPLLIQILLWNLWIRNSQTCLQFETTVNRMSTANHACVQPRRAGTGAAQLCSFAPAWLLPHDSSRELTLSFMCTRMPHLMLSFALSSLLFPFSPWPKATLSEWSSCLGDRARAGCSWGGCQVPPLEIAFTLLFGFCRRTLTASVARSKVWWYSRARQMTAGSCVYNVPGFFAFLDLC